MWFSRKNEITRLKQGNTELQARVDVLQGLQTAAEKSLEDCKKAMQLQEGIHLEREAQLLKRATDLEYRIEQLTEYFDDLGLDVQKIDSSRSSVQSGAWWKRAVKFIRLSIDTQALEASTELGSEERGYVRMTITSIIKPPHSKTAPAETSPTLHTGKHAARIEAIRNPSLKQQPGEL